MADLLLDVRDAVMTGKDALDAVRGFGGLDLSGVLEGLEGLGGLLGVKLLAAFVFAKLADGLEKTLGERLALDDAIEEGVQRR
jgi:hypothetical protein